MTRNVIWHKTKVKNALAYSFLSESSSSRLLYFCSKSIFTASASSSARCNVTCCYEIFRVLDKDNRNLIRTTKTRATIMDELTIKHLHASYIRTACFASNSALALSSSLGGETAEKSVHECNFFLMH